MVVIDERLQVRRLLIFFRIFLKMSSKESFFFPGEEMVALKLFSFWPAHSQGIAKSSKVMGWFYDSSFFLIFRCWWGNQMFSKSVLILEDIRRTKLMSIFRCRSEVFSFFFCDVDTCRIFLRWHEVEVFNRWLLKSSKMFRGRGKSRVVAMLWSNQNFLSFRRKLRSGRWVHLDVSFLKCRLRILEEK